MIVVLSTYGSRGDVEPIVALAVELRARGVQVRVCLPPDEEFTRLLSGTGVTVLPFGREWRSWVRPNTPAERTRRVGEFIDEQYGRLLAAAEGADVLVATGMSHFVAPSVAETVGIPHRYVTFCPIHVNGVDTEDWNPLFGPAINAHRASIGLGPVEDVRAFMFTAEPWLAADPVLGPLDGPVGLPVTTTGAWIRADDRPLPADLDAFLAAGEPPVYVGFGSMRVAPGAAAVAVEAIRAQGRRALVGRGWAELTPIDDRDDCFAVGEVNQQALFARVAAVMHHGGAGTTTTAARAGVPQVVLPQAGDQPYWAARVANLGIGAAHEGPTPTFASLSPVLGTALAAPARARAAAVAGTIRTDGARVAASTVVSIP